MLLIIINNKITIINYEYRYSNFKKYYGIQICLYVAGVILSLSLSFFLHVYMYMYLYVYMQLYNVACTKVCQECLSVYKLLYKKEFNLCVVTILDWYSLISCYHTFTHTTILSLSLSITLRVSLFHNTFYLISINSLSFMIFPLQLQSNLSSCCYKNVSLCHYVVLLHLLRLSW